MKIDIEKILKNMSVDLLKKYLSANEEDPRIESICDRFNISKSQLDQLIKNIIDKPEKDDTKNSTTHNIYEEIYGKIIRNNIKLNFENISEFSKKFNLPEIDLLNFLKEKTFNGNQDIESKKIKEEQSRKINLLNEKINSLNGIKKQMIVTYINYILIKKNIADYNNKSLNEKIEALTDDEIENTFNYINSLDSGEYLINLSDNLMNKLIKFGENLKNKCTDNISTINKENNIDDFCEINPSKENDETDYCEESTSSKNQHYDINEINIVERINSLSEDRKDNLLHYIDFLLDENILDCDKDSINRFVKKFINQIEKDRLK